jgi:RNA-directed DNA polymerase
LTSAKPFVIPKRLVWEAYQRVKANRGSAGIDGQSIKDFDLKLGKKKISIAWAQDKSICLA